MNPFIKTIENTFSHLSTFFNEVQEMGCIDKSSFTYKLACDGEDITSLLSYTQSVKKLCTELQTVIEELSSSEKVISNGTWKEASPNGRSTRPRDDPASLLFANNPFGQISNAKKVKIKVLSDVSGQTQSADRFHTMKTCGQTVDMSSDQKNKLNCAETSFQDVLCPPINLVAPFESLALNSNTQRFGFKEFRDKLNQIDRPINCFTRCRKCESIRTNTKLFGSMRKQCNSCYKLSQAQRAKERKKLATESTMDSGHSLAHGANHVKMTQHQDGTANTMVSTHDTSDTMGPIDYIADTMVPTNDTADTMVPIHENTDTIVLSHNTADTMVQSHDTADTMVQSHDTADTMVPSHDTTDTMVPPHDTTDTMISTTDSVLHQLSETKTYFSRLPVFCCHACKTTSPDFATFSQHECSSFVTTPQGMDEDPTKTTTTTTPTTTTNCKLVYNIKVLQDLKKYVCIFCNLEFRSLGRIIYHLRRCSPGPYACNVCSNKFNTLARLNLHKKCHRSERCFCCEECGKKFLRKSSLRKHCVKHHESLPFPGEVEGSFKCDSCPKKFVKKIFLTNHQLRMHELQKKFLCQVCGKKFVSESSLGVHMDTLHGGVEQTFDCQYCDRSFCRKEKMVHHERQHTGERPYECTKCTKTFVSTTRLNEHLRRHDAQKRFDCPLCLKSYASMWDLKKHTSKKHNLSTPPENVKVRLLKPENRSRMRDPEQGDDSILRAQLPPPQATQALDPMSEQFPHMSDSDPFQMQGNVPLPEAAMSSFQPPFDVSPNCLQMELNNQPSSSSSSHLQSTTIFNAQNNSSNTLYANT